LTEYILPFSKQCGIFATNKTNIFIQKQCAYKLLCIQIIHITDRRKVMKEKSFVEGDSVNDQKIQ
jgi:hypothetical protein